jgi:hypothetical protein
MCFPLVSEALNGSKLGGDRHKNKKEESNEKGTTDSISQCNVADRWSDFKPSRLRGRQWPSYTPVSSGANIRDTSRYWVGRDRYRKTEVFLSLSIFFVRKKTELSRASPPSGELALCFGARKRAKVFVIQPGLSQENTRKDFCPIDQLELYSKSWR